MVSTEEDEDRRKRMEVVSFIMKQWWQHFVDGLEKDELCNSLRSFIEM